MVFNSIHFAVFFLIVYVSYLFLGHRWQNLLLLAASYIFYAFWDWRFLSLIIASTLVNYYCGLKIGNEPDRRRRKIFFITCVCFDLGVLGIFKYFNFFLEGFKSVLGLFGIQAGFATLDIILPLGISFYTFQVMSYPIDLYRDQIKPTNKFFDFALFVSFFPQIISGPIERARNMLPQFLNKRNITLDQFYGGCWLIFWGLYKKIVIADNLAKITKGVFASTADVPGNILILASYVFVFQIYADFSGYSDIARGLARVMGFNIMVNFRTPFFSINPSELWQRWHISLTTWIKEYLFYPLALAKFFGKQLGAYSVILITWTLMGFWHGPNLKFILWGFYQGLIIIIYSRLRPYLGLIKPKSRIVSNAWAALQMLVIFNLFSFGILFFAAPTTADVFYAVRNIVSGFSGYLLFEPNIMMLLAVLFVPLLIIEYFQYKTQDELVVFRLPILARGILYYVLLYLMIFNGDFGGKQYYYFQF